MKTKMLNWEHGGGTDGFRFAYGLGLMPMAWGLKKGEDGSDHTKYWLYGHAGMDWGSYADLAGYSVAWKFSLTNGGNAISGLDCNLKNSSFYENYAAQDDLDCNILNETL